jgi:uncharacterized membrane protein (UPF0127 family)
MEQLLAAEGVCLATRVQIAGTFRSRLIGLLSRSALASDEALLLSPGGSIHTFGMRFPIDALFLARDFRVLAVARSVKPWRFRLAPPKTHFVLEVAAGRSEAVGAQVGMQLVVQ